jgi:hypothetical protein
MVRRYQVMFLLLMVQVKLKGVCICRMDFRFIVYRKTNLNGSIAVNSAHDYDSQPVPSPSRSNPCGSGGKTVKSLSAISPQSKSGGGRGIHTSGYEGSQFPLCIRLSSRREKNCRSRQQYNR